MNETINALSKFNFPHYAMKAVSSQATSSCVVSHCFGPLMDKTIKFFIHVIKTAQFPCLSLSKKRNQASPVICQLTDQITFFEKYKTESLLTLVMCFLHPIFRFFGFWSVLVTNLRNYKRLHNLCLHFARQDGQDGKKRKEKHATKVTKIQKTKRQKCGMNETIHNRSF